MIHPQSYVHSIIRFRNGLIKMILYNTDMKIPISNILYGVKDPHYPLFKHLNSVHVPAESDSTFVAKAHEGANNAYSVEYLIFCDSDEIFYFIYIDDINSFTCPSTSSKLFNR